jgi:UDP-N-acetylglucosamine diphosphorylase/glucosamine-1-phosphate N-acetyltransferase
MAPGLVLFDDDRARQWAPFALTRPAGELRFGASTLVERAERALGLDCIGYLTSEHLAGFSEPGARAVLSFDDLPEDRDLVFWCSRAAADPEESVVVPSDPAVFLMDGRPVGLYAPAGGRPDRAFFDQLTLDSGPPAEVHVAGRLLERIWDLVLHTPDQLIQDLSSARGSMLSGLPDGVYSLGAQPLILGRSVRIEPGSLFDTRDGPILVGDEVEIRAGTRLAGPAAVGRRSRLLGGSFERISAGPYSYLRGEVAETVVLGYSNKAHDGYLGHSYVGKWVNLGAFTTNSDLKNNYRPVRVWSPSGLVDTGEMKVGCFLGDHVKTGIGLLLGTGTVVGAGANLYGSVMPPRYVEPFSWGEGDDLGEYRLAEFLDTAEAAMARRGVDLDERGRRFLEGCWRKGRGG